MSEFAIPLQPEHQPALRAGHAPAPSRYVQALRTYWRPIPITVSALVFLASIVPVLLATNLIQLSLASAACMTASVISALVLFQMRNQFDDSRSTLTPGFRSPHLVAAAVILALPNLLAPVVLSLITPHAFTGLFAYTLALTAIVGWMCYEPVATIALLILLANLIPSHVVMVNGLPEDFAPIARLAPFTILLSALALLSLLLIFSRLNGETAANTTSSENLNIHLRPRSSGARANFALGPVTLFVGKLLNLLQTALGSLRTRTVPIVPAASDTSFLAAVQRRRRATFFGFSPPLFALLLGMVAVILYFLGTWNDGAPPPAATLTLFFFYFPACLWIAMAGAFWPKQWLYLPAESLFPATRNRFIREYGSALLFDHLAFWLTSSLVATLSALLLFPHDIERDLARSVLCSLLTGASFLFSFGLFTWTMLFRNAIVSFIALIVAFQALVFCISATIDPIHFSDFFSVLPPQCWGLALVGPLFAARAYFRWLRTDLT